MTNSFKTSFLFILFIVLFTTACDQILPKEKTESGSSQEAPAEPISIAAEADSTAQAPTIKLEDAISVTLEKPKAIYIGIENIFNLHVPDIVDPGSIRLSANGAGAKMRIIDSAKKKYIITATQPGTCIVNVSIPDEDGSSAITKKFDFQVKRIPNPVAQLSKHLSGAMGSGEFKIQPGLFAVLKDFDGEAQCQIAQFNTIRIPKRQDATTVLNRGSRFSGETSSLIGKATPGDIFLFENVKAKCPGDRASRTINSLVFRIR